jgi:uncharacterized membrane protein YsdA (DUF1294 family)
MRVAWEILAAYLAVANFAAFVAFGWDKRRALRGGRRMPEAVLLGLAAAGGLAGAYAAMPLFRHKTQKRAFRWRLHAILAAWAAAVAAAVWLWTR